MQRDKNESALTEVLTAVSVRITAFTDMTTSLANRFEGTYCFHPQGRDLTKLHHI